MDRAAAEEASMKIFLSGDMEGTAGVMDWNQCIGDGPRPRGGRLAAAPARLRRLAPVCSADSAYPLDGEAGDAGEPCWALSAEAAAARGAIACPSGWCSGTGLPSSR
jgi:hypothetical protein